MTRQENYLTVYFSHLYLFIAHLYVLVLFLCLMEGEQDKSRLFFWHLNLVYREQIIILNHQTNLQAVLSI